MLLSEEFFSAPGLLVVLLLGVETRFDLLLASAFRDGIVFGRDDIVFGLVLVLSNLLLFYFFLLSRVPTVSAFLQLHGMLYSPGYRLRCLVFNRAGAISMHIFDKTIYFLKHDFHFQLITTSKIEVLLVV